MLSELWHTFENINVGLYVEFRVDMMQGNFTTAIFLEFK